MFNFQIVLAESSILTGRLLILKYIANVRKGPNSTSATGTAVKSFLPKQ